jgi:hypothetical protein
MADVSPASILISGGGHGGGAGDGGGGGAGDGGGGDGGDGDPHHLAETYVVYDPYKL